MIYLKLKHEAAYLKENLKEILNKYIEKRKLEKYGEI